MEDYAQATWVILDCPEQGWSCGHVVTWSPAQAVKEMQRLRSLYHTHLQQYQERDIISETLVLPYILVCLRVQGDPDSYMSLSCCLESEGLYTVNETWLHKRGIKMRDRICSCFHPDAVAEEATGSSKNLVSQRGSESAGPLLGKFLFSLDLAYVYLSFGFQFKVFPPGSLP